MYEAIQEARAHDCTYIKYNKNTQALTFVWCLGWECDLEPVVLKTVTVFPNGRITFRDFSDSSNPPIIHGKHLFVDKAHCTFDYDAAENRWNSYQGQSWIDKKRMGYLHWWQSNAGPRIGVDNRDELT